MKSKAVRQFLQFLVLGMTGLLAIFGLSAHLMGQHPPLTLKLNIECSEYVADGFDPHGDLVGSGGGSFLTLAGRLDYNSSTMSELKKVVAKIMVHNAANTFQLHDEILIQLNASGTSVFTKEFDFPEWTEPPYCAGYKYSVAFYSPEGKLIPHEGDLENSIKDPRTFLFSTPVY